MLIQDVKPYPSRLQAIVATFHCQAVSMNGKPIKIHSESSQERTERIESYWLYDEQQYNKHGITEDDLIQGQQ